MVMRSRAGLRWLDLSGNDLRDEGAAMVLLAAAKSSALIGLDLAQNSIGQSASQTADALAGAGGLLATCTSLRTLSLAHNSLGDDFAATLFLALTASTKSPASSAWSGAAASVSRVHAAAAPAERAPAAPVAPRRDGLPRLAPRTPSAQVHTVCRLSVLDLRFNNIGTKGVLSRPASSAAPSSTLSPSSRRILAGMSYSAPGLSRAEAALLALLSSGAGSLRELCLQHNRLGGEWAMRAYGAIRARIGTPLVSSGRLGLWFMRLAGNSAVAKRDRRRLATVLRHSRETWVLQRANALGLSSQELDRWYGHAGAAAMMGEPAARRGVAEGQTSSHSPLASPLPGSPAGSKQQDAGGEEHSHPREAGGGQEEGGSEGGASDADEKRASPDKPDARPKQRDSAATVRFAGRPETGPSSALDALMASMPEAPSSLIQPGAGSLREAQEEATAAGKSSAVTTETARSLTGASKPANSRTAGATSAAAPVAEENEEDDDEIPPCTMVLLGASPLACKVVTPGEGFSLMQLPAISVEAERAAVWNAFAVSRAHVRFDFGFASWDAVHSALSAVDGISILHISAHGSENTQEGLLGLEEADGMTDIKQLADLKAALDSIAAASPTGSVPIQLAFINACNSQDVGEVLVAAGVPHVICVRKSFRIADEAGPPFVGEFYRQLGYGNTVAKAFELAKQRVLTMPDLPPDQRRPQAEGFVLLPTQTPSSMFPGADEATVMHYRRKLRRGDITVANKWRFDFTCGPSHHDVSIIPPPPRSASAPARRPWPAQAHLPIVKQLESLGKQGGMVPIRRDRALAPAPTANAPGSGNDAASPSEQALALVAGGLTHAASAQSSGSGKGDAGGAVVRGMPGALQSSSPFPHPLLLVPAGVFEDFGVDFSSRRGRLPPAVPDGAPFCGRRVAASQLLKLVLGSEQASAGPLRHAAGGSRVVVTGADGVGKSALALFVCHFLAIRRSFGVFSGGIFYADMVGCTTAESAANRIAASLFGSLRTQQLLSAYHSKALEHHWESAMLLAVAEALEAPTGLDTAAASGAGSTEAETNSSARQRGGRAVHGRAVAGGDKATLLDLEGAVSRQGSRRRRGRGDEDTEDDFDDGHGEEEEDEEDEEDDGGQGTARPRSRHGRRHRPRGKTAGGDAIGRRRLADLRPRHGPSSGEGVRRAGGGRGGGSKQRSRRRAEAHSKVSDALAIAFAAVLSRLHCLIALDNIDRVPTGFLRKLEVRLREQGARKVALLATRASKYPRVGATPAYAAASSVGADSPSTAAAAAACAAPAAMADGFTSAGALQTGPVSSSGPDIIWRDNEFPLTRMSLEDSLDLLEARLGDGPAKVSRDSIKNLFYHYLGHPAMMVRAAAEYRRRVTMGLGSQQQQQLYSNATAAPPGASADAQWPVGEAEFPRAMQTLRPSRWSSVPGVGLKTTPAAANAEERAYGTAQAATAAPGAVTAGGAASVQEEGPSQAAAAEPQGGAPVPGPAAEGASVRRGPFAEAFAREMQVVATVRRTRQDHSPAPGARGAAPAAPPMHSSSATREPSGIHRSMSLGAAPASRGWFQPTNGKR
jgi:hypothetical protein